MKCPKCGEDNLSSASSCSSCGLPFGLTCPSCGFENREGSTYCGGCGAALPDNGAGAPAGERRQLTVLFCDLIGATELSQSMDPEDLRDLLAAYHKVCAGAVAAHEGYIAQYLGDGVLIYFGYPRAHEDEAQRAVRCGLDILEGMRKLAAEGPRTSLLSVRVGAHTGRVVVGPVGGGGRHTQIAVGETPNVAARIQAAAPDGAIAVSETTWSIVRGYFAATDLGERALKGVAQPLRLWAVTGRSGWRDRVEIPGYLTPLVGREEQQQALLQIWREARAGQSSFVLISGEPGIGKSRLAQWIREEVEGSAQQVLNMRATPYSSTNPFFPIIELLQGRFGITPSMPDQERLDRLEQALEARGVTGPEAVGLFGPLLSVPTENRYPLLELSPARRRARTMELLVDLAVRLAGAGPTVMVLEDLHWADPSSLEFLDRIVDLAPAVPLLVICTARPEVQPKWTAAANARIIDLPRLDRADTGVIVRKIASDKPLPSELLRQILIRAEGVPLFAEEVTRFVLDSGLLQEHAAGWVTVGEVPSDAIPATIEASLTTRIDRLGPSRETAQLAATIGREFTWELLCAVSDRELATLHRDLDHLVQSGLVSATQPASWTFSFKHSLVRDAAYNSLLRSVRQSYHSRIATALLERFPEEAAQRPDLIADHLALAGQEQSAVTYNEAAGRQALARASLHEAADHFRRALSGLAKASQTPETLTRQLEILIQLAPLLMNVYGWGAKEVEDACQRALQIAASLGRHDLSYAPMWGLWTVRFLRGELVQATADAESVLRLAQASGLPMMEITGRHATGYTALYRGEFERALEEADAGLALFDFAQEKSLAQIFSLSSSVSLLAIRATSLWMTGRVREAEASWDQMLRLGRDLGHVPSLAATLAFVLHGGGFRYSYIGEMQRLLEPADELMRLCKEEDFFLWHSVGQIYRGIVAAALGEREQAVRMMEEGTELFEQTQSRLTLVFMNVLCAEALHRMGEDGLALAKLEAAESEMRQRDEGLLAPDIWRVRGAVMAAQGDGAGAEAAYREALRRARRQGACTLELRAAIDLYDLFDRQGRPAPAKVILARVCDSLPGGGEGPEAARAAAIVRAAPD